MATPTGGQTGIPTDPYEEEIRRKQAAQGATAATTNTAGQPASGIMDVASDIGSGLADAASGIAGVVSDVGSGLADAGKSAVNAIGGFLNGDGTKAQAYDPNVANFQLGGDTTNAATLAQGFTTQQQQAQQQGQNVLNTAQTQAYTDRATGEKARLDQERIARENAALGGANAQKMGTLGQNFYTQGNGVQQRQGVNVDYGQANTLGNQFANDQATARGIVGAQMAYANQGPGPSLAQAQLQQGAEAAQLRNLSLARSGRGFGENAAALRQAVSANADVQAQTNQAAAGLRAQEADAWRGRQLQAMGQAQQGQASIGAQGLTAQGQAAQMSQYQAQLADAQRARNDAMQQQLDALGLNAQEFGMNNQLGYNQLANENYNLGYNTELGFVNAANQGLAQGENYNLGMNQVGQKYADMGLKTYEDQLAAMVDFEKLRSENNQNVNLANAQMANNNRMGIINMVSQGIGSLWPSSDDRSSDERSKKKIKRLEDEREAMMHDVDVRRAVADWKARERSPKYKAEIGQAKLEPSKYKAEIGQAKLEPSKYTAEIGRAKLEPPKPPPMSPEERHRSQLPPAARKFYDYVNHTPPGDNSVFPINRLFRFRPEYQEVAPKRETGAPPNFYYPDEEVTAMNRYKLSDEQSKGRIKELEQQVAALGGKPGSTTYSEKPKTRYEQARGGLPSTGQEANRPSTGRMPDMTPDQAWASDFMSKRDAMMNGLQKDMQPPPGPIDFRGAPGYSYQYKDPNQPGASPGQHVGPMAQDLTHVPGVVHQQPDGRLGVDTGALTLANTAALSQAQRQNEALRKQLEQLNAQMKATYGSAYPTEPY